MNSSRNCFYSQPLFLPRPPHSGFCLSSLRKLLFPWLTSVCNSKDERSVLLGWDSAAWDLLADPSHLLDTLSPGSWHQALHLFPCIFPASPLSPRPLSALSPSTPSEGDLPESVILRSFCWPGVPSSYLQPICLCDCSWHNFILKVFTGAGLTPWQMAGQSPWTPGVMVTPSCRLFSIILETCPSLMSHVRSVHKAFCVCLWRICRYLMMLRNYGYIFKDMIMVLWCIFKRKPHLLEILTEIFIDRTIWSLELEYNLGQWFSSGGLMNTDFWVSRPEFLI